jgi:uncharacterized membrane protein YoaK (UPF0700 family)
MVERDVLLGVLAVSAGSADGWSFFGLGHAFVANMTGNTVFLGMSIFQKHGDPLHFLISLACYAAGVITGSLLTRNIQAESNSDLWPHALSRTLLLEALLLVLAEAAWITTRIHLTPSSNGTVPLTLLLGTVAFAIGLQSAAMLRLKIPGIVTTYISGTWTTLMSGLVRVKSTPAPEKNEFEGRLLMQGAILAVYLLSAVLTGCLFRYVPAGVGALPALSVLFVAIYGEMRPLNPSSQPVLSTPYSKTVDSRFPRANANRHPSASGRA